MSPPRRHRPAAWPGLSGGALSWVDAPGPLAREVAAALGRPGTVRVAANAGGGASTFLRFDAPPGDALFLKLVPGHRDAALAEAEALASWLRDQGLPVVAALGRQPMPGGRTLWTYPFHEGRLPQPTTQDMAAVGEALGRLHRGLAAHPMRAQWLSRTDERLARLDAVRQALAQGALRAGPDPSRLQRLAADGSVGFDAARHGPQAGRTPLHGDLNLFNLLIGADGRCTFLDLEDVHHSVLAPVHDLATVYERVVLVQEPSPGDRAALLGELLGAHGRACGDRVEPSRIAPVLQGLALRALCTLADSDPAGDDDREWRKFFHLMDLSSDPIPSAPR